MSKKTKTKQKTFFKGIAFFLVELFIFSELSFAHQQEQATCLSPSVDIKKSSFHETFQQIYMRNYSLTPSVVIPNLTDENQKKEMEILKAKIKEEYQKNNPENLLYQLKTLDTVLEIAENYYMEKSREKRFVSGEFYFYHTLLVAYRLAQCQCSLEVISAGILHRMPEEKIREIFLGKIEKTHLEEITKLISSFLKISELSYEMSVKGKYNIQNFMNVIVQMTHGDYRLMQLVFADKLASLKTASEIDREELTKEATYIYGPLAERIGDFDLKDEFLNEAFRLSQPVTYNLVLERVQKTFGLSFEELEKYLQKREEKLKLALEDYLKELKEKYQISIKKVVISSRVKKPYQIFEKEEREKPKEKIGKREIPPKGKRELTTKIEPLRIKDVLGIRLICSCDAQELFNFQDLIKDAIGVWSLQDYEWEETGAINIEIEKAHDGLSYAVQILTEKFHNQREAGKWESGKPHWLAHWAYKLNKRTNQLFDSELFEPVGDFAADFRRVYYSLKPWVFVFGKSEEKNKTVLTSKRLRRGATIEDFASLRSVDKFGANYRGANIYEWRNKELKIKNKRNNLLPGSYTLKPGDVVEILEAKNFLINLINNKALNVAVARAKAQHLRTHVLFSGLDQENKKEKIALGKKRLEGKLGIVLIPESNVVRKFLMPFANTLRLRNVEELYIAIIDYPERISIDSIIEIAKEKGQKLLTDKFDLTKEAIIFQLGQVSHILGVETPDKLFIQLGTGQRDIEKIVAVMKKTKLEVDKKPELPLKKLSEYQFRITLPKVKKSELISLEKRIKGVLMEFNSDKMPRITTKQNIMRFVVKSDDAIKVNALKEHFEQTVVGAKIRAVKKIDYSLNIPLSKKTKEIKSPLLSLPIEFAI